MRTHLYHRFNLKSLRSMFGDKNTRLLKDWLNYNYKVIKIFSHISFLTECKRRNFYPKHLNLSRLFNIRVTHYIALRRLNKLFDGLQSRLLNIEIFDLYRTVDHLRHVISHLTFILQNSFPSFI